jgi:hypothetical protein
MVKKAEDHLREKNRIGLLKTQKTQWVLKKAKKAMDKVKDKDKVRVRVRVVPPLPPHCQQERKRR